jgi:glucose dehydrogenase
MRPHPRRAGVHVVLAAVALAGCGGEPGPDHREWRVSSGDWRGTRYSSLDQIDRNDVRGLEPAWIFRTGDMRQAPASIIECTPIVIDGTMYLTTPRLKVVELEARGLPPTGTFNIGGPLVTVGGLVFIGAAMDEPFHAYDAETGALLWEYQMDAGGYARPATFEVDGRQHLVIAAGGGGKPETRPGDACYCFALPGGQGAGEGARSRSRLGASR